MSFYNKYILPRLTHMVCSSHPAGMQRSKIIPFASGHILEIGIGSGLNLKYYDPGKVDSIIGVDPSTKMLSIAHEKIAHALFPIELINGVAEEIPVVANSIDTIVVTYTLCSIPDLKMAFAEFRRVLKPGGKLLFCEHGLAPDLSIQKWQKRLNPAWRRFSGGCHLDRHTPDIIKEGSFRILSMESMYIPGPKIASFNFWGVARPM